MISHAMFCCAKYAVVIFLFTLSTCNAGPVQVANANVPQFTNDEDILQQLPVQDLLEQCPDSPVVQWLVLEALKDYKVCVHTTIEGIPLKDLSTFGKKDKLRHISKFMCSSLSAVQPCIQDFLTSLKICIPDYPVEDVVSGYEQGVSIACVNGGEKLAAAIGEVVEESDECLKAMFSKFDSCSRIQKSVEAAANRSVAYCKKMMCIKDSLNVCGGSKKHAHELLDNFIDAINRNDPNVKCSSVSLSPARVLYATTVLFAVLVGVVTRRGYLI